MGLTVSWSGPDGSVWPLEGDFRELSGVVLTKPSGLVGTVNRESAVRPDGLGADITGFLVPQMQGSLQVRIFPDKAAGLDLAGVYRAWVASFSMFNPGTLTVHDSWGQQWSVNAVLAEAIKEPELSPATRGLPFIDMEVELLCADGLWTGKKREFTKNRFDLTNEGDVISFPRIGWSGDDQVLQMPGEKFGFRLPTVAGWRWLSTNPGEGYKVVSSDGVIDRVAWRAMRGRDVYGGMKPGETKNWFFTVGMVLEWTPRRLNPWR